MLALAMGLLIASLSCCLHVRAMGDSFVCSIPGRHLECFAVDLLRAVAVIGAVGCHCCV